MSLRNNFVHSHSTLASQVRDALQMNGFPVHSARSRSPNGLQPLHLTNTAESDPGADDDPKLSVFRELIQKSEARFGTLFGGENAGDDEKEHDGDHIVTEHQRSHTVEVVQPKVVPPPKKPARTIEEDDYDDDDSGDEEDAPVNVSPLKAKSTGIPALPGLLSTPVRRPLSIGSGPNSAKATPSTNVAKTSEDIRKKLEEDKKASEDAAKRSFHTEFHTLENDKDAMLDQKRLEESDRQVDVEMNGSSNHGANVHGTSGNGQQGTLSQTNLGASSLTLKHLIARIDAKRNMVKSSDAELRSLMSEVRKNRSKWANEDRVGQEELYEAAEKVLNELKAMTEHSSAFLTRVNKREAPDYSNVIKHPMDLGSMTKKLKAIQYKSKQEFVDDLNLIWANCLKYNANPEHFLRRHALFMRKETEKLVPLIPAIVIRDRAEVEAEERRQQQAEAEIDGGEESDEEPIIASRGRKAPGKKTKKGIAPRKAPPSVLEGSPAAENKPSLHSLANGLGSNLKSETLRASSENREGSHKDFATPPPGTHTPAGVNGILSHDATSVHSDPMDVDSIDTTLNCHGQLAGGIGEEVDHDDVEYKAWKQVTKKDRATVTAERHRLFKGNRINPEEHALLRNKVGMRRWLRKQKQAVADGVLGQLRAEAEVTEAEEAAPGGETLAEGMEGEEERTLPDYYDTLAGIPDLPPRTRWKEDSEGQVQDPSEDFLRVLPQGLFISGDSSLTRKIKDNMRQMQQTRKVCSKIGVVKQMQIQAQMYHGQFQKHEPLPLIEQDIEPHVMSDEGPVVSPWVSRAALQRSVAAVCFHAGFEEFQPSALDAFTEIAGDYFTKLAASLVGYSQTPKVAVQSPLSDTAGEAQVTWKSRFSQEEMILHSLQDSGTDLDALDTYVSEDIDRAGNRFTTMHDRMKAHLADLLRPALHDAGPDGSNAFNDGSEQFIGGDFAEELGEDFFGFKELGLDVEFGMGSLGVPLHLLQNRMHQANQAQNPG
ncbi:MAG: hypothetical protein Q9191_001019, partial [Dirinaria sp. TL-2023a]